MVPGSARNWIAVNALQQSSLNKKLKTKNMTTLHLRKSIGRSPLRLGFLLLSLVLVCFGLLPTAQAVLPPPTPDGGYPGGNTAEGDGALFNLTTGVGNTAIGSSALPNDTTGSFNTANGAQALANGPGGAPFSLFFSLVSHSGYRFMARRSTEVSPYLW